MHGARLCQGLHISRRCPWYDAHLQMLSSLASFATAQSQPFVPSEDKEARGAQLQETLKAAGPVKGGPDQVRPNP